MDPMEARAGRKDPEARGINGDGYSSNRSLDRLQVTLHDRELALPSFERHREPANDVNLTPGGGKVGTGTGPEDPGVVRRGAVGGFSWTTSTDLTFSLSWLNWPRKIID